MKPNKVYFDQAVALKITLYFGLAFSISYLFTLLPTLLPIEGIKWVLNVGFGPSIAAILVSSVYKTPLKVTLLSPTRWVRKIELVGLGIFFAGTLINQVWLGKTTYWHFMVWSVLALYYTLLEELGWRVFLGNELGKYSFLMIVIVSTLLWFSWHYSFPNRLIQTKPLHFLGMIAAGSAGMAEFYRKTKSWLLVALTHALVNVNPPSLPILLIFLAVMIGLLKVHEIKTKDMDIPTQR